MKRGLLCVVVIVLVAGCRNARSEPLPTIPPPTVTFTPWPTITPKATRTPSITPQLQASPTTALAATITPTVPPSPTVLPTVTVMPTAIPTTTPLPTVPPALAKRDMVVNPDNRLNLRAEPSATSTLLRPLPPSTHLIALGPASAPDADGVVWQNVQTDDGLTGWVAVQFLIEQTAISPTPTATPSTAAKHDVYVNPDNRLNLRAEPNAAGTWLSSLPPGTHLIALGLASASDADGVVWQNVQTDDGLTGWVAAQYLTDQKAVSPTLAATLPAATKRDVYVNPNSRLNLRAEPNAAGTWLSSLPPGTHLIALGPASAPDADGVAWQNVQTDDGQTGWVAAQYLVNQKPANTPTPTATTPAN